MTVRVALIGVGNQGLKNILPSILQVENAKVCALVDADESKIKRVAKSMGIDTYSTEYKRIIDKKNIDAIFVACPPQIHVEISRYAIERGVSVFVEKPPSVTLAQIKMLHTLAQKMNVVTGVGLNFRFAAPYQKLHAIVQNPNFGKPSLIHIKHYANKPTESMWGLNSEIKSLLLAQAIHPLDLLLSYGETINKQHIDFFKGKNGIIVRVNVVFEDGLLGSVCTGSLFPQFDSGVEIVSDKGRRVSLDSLWNLHVSCPENGGPFPKETKRWALDWNPSPLDSGYERSGYYGEIKAFIDAVEKGGIYEPSFESQIRVYKLMEDIEKKYIQQFGNS